MTGTRNLPGPAGLDSSFALLREGYTFIGDRCRRLHSDAFRTRLMLSRAVCMRGAEAAEAFYAGGRCSRERAMPVTVLKLLQDRGSVQSLEGEAHHHRKRMFLSLLGRDGAPRLVEQFSREWRERVPVWERASRIVLFDQVRHVLFRAACAWAGIPMRSDEEAVAREREFAAMIEATGDVGPRNWRALWLRRRSERWARDILLRVRNGISAAPPDSAVHAIAHHRDLDGRPMHPETAAVELLNIIRPIVAVAHYVVFTALALHQHPEWRRTFRSGNDADLQNFVQEVRRLSPFFPFAGGRVRKAFRWRNTDFRRGEWVLLDLYGTCRHPRDWTEPDAFRPERFRDRAPGFAFVPQGGGSYETDHRCPGEPATIALMMESVRLLTRTMGYDVPEQDLSVDLARIPALPNSGFVMRAVRASQEPG